MSARRAGLPIAVKMRHDAHYVEEIISRSGAAIGRMIPLEDLQPNADQPRKDQGDLRGLSESVREKGVLEPLLVRRLPESEKYLIISGERRYHAARAAGLTEVPCIEKDADDSETLELALIENLQRKDLTPFEEADGMHALADRLGLTHEEIARKLGKSRSLVTEILSLRSIPDAIKALAFEKGVLSKSQLLQVARQPNEARMKDVIRRFAAGMLNREQARRERHPEKQAHAAAFRYIPPGKEFSLVLKFRKNQFALEEVVNALQAVIEAVKSEFQGERG